VHGRDSFDVDLYMLPARLIDAETACGIDNLLRIDRQLLRRGGFGELQDFTGKPL